MWRDVNRGACKFKCLSGMSFDDEDLVDLLKYCITRVKFKEMNQEFVQDICDFVRYLERHYLEE